jgi:hypothetical protein
MAGPPPECIYDFDNQFTASQQKDNQMWKTSERTALQSNEFAPSLLLDQHIIDTTPEIAAQRNAVGQE